MDGHFYTDMQMCEKCHTREATCAALLPHEGPNIKLTRLCQECFESEEAKSPKGLLDLIDEMEGQAPGRRGRLVFELSRDGARPADRAAVAQMHEVYRQDGWDMHIAEGRISKIFPDERTGEQMFEIDEGAGVSTWPLQGDHSAYGVGSKARVEYIIFGAPEPTKQTYQVVTRIWIEEESDESKAPDQ
jgi:hypothetical protein